MNPAERVFEYLRSKVEGQVYGTIAAKKEAIEVEIKGLAATQSLDTLVAHPRHTGSGWSRERLLGVGAYYVAEDGKESRRPPPAQKGAAGTSAAPSGRSGQVMFFGCANSFHHLAARGTIQERLEWPL